MQRVKASSSPGSGGEFKETVTDQEYAFTATIPHFVEEVWIGVRMEVVSTLYTAPWSLLVGRDFSYDAEASIIVKEIRVSFQEE